LNEKRRKGLAQKISRNFRQKKRGAKRSRPSEANSELGKKKPGQKRLQKNNEQEGSHKDWEGSRSQIDSARRTRSLGGEFILGRGAENSESLKKKSKLEVACRKKRRSIKPSAKITL